MSAPRSTSRGIQSVELGGEVLRAFARAEGPLSVSAVARETGMAPAKVHRYLVAFVRAGLLTQDRATSEYDIGPLGVGLGLAALRRLDPLHRATTELHELRDEINQTVLLVMWTDNGPVVATAQASNAPVSLAIRAGTSVPLLTSASGRIFLAYRNDESVEGIARKERVAAKLKEKDLRTMAEQVRADGGSSVEGEFDAGVGAFAAPIFDRDGSLAAALAVIVHTGKVDFSVNGRLAKAVKAAAARWSAVTEFA